MNAFFLLCHFLIIRFVLLSVLNGKAIRRAAYFAPLQGGERIAYCIYQISNIAVFLSLFFLTVKIDFTWFFYLGLGCYLVGLCLCTAVVVSFSAPDENGLNTKEQYRRRVRRYI